MSNAGRFQLGNKLSKGRPPGSKSKRSLEFQRVLEEYEFDSAEALLDIYEVASSCFNYANREEKPIYLKLALDAAREIASYSYPKLKSIERKPTNALEGMSPQEKLQAMKQAVLLLEGEIKKSGSSSS